PIFMPIAMQLGFDPLWFVIVLAVNLQMSFITPPFGYALFYVKGTVTPDMGIKLIDIYKGIIPFVLLQMLGLVIVSVWPQLATWLPTLVGN
nr:TRAP transporter large permease subunit [Syntrophales bacterium]